MLGVVQLASGPFTSKAMAPTPPMLSGNTDPSSSCKLWLLTLRPPSLPLADKSLVPNVGTASSSRLSSMATLLATSNDEYQAGTKLGWSSLALQILSVA
jgi:hypothetical protein